MSLGVPDTCFKSGNPPNAVSLIRECLPLLKNSNPFANRLRLAFSSLSRMHPHSQAWVLWDKDFLTMRWHKLHSWEVYWGGNRTGFFESGISFLFDGWIFAVVIETLNRLSCSFGRCLTSLRIQLFRPLVFLGQNSTESWQVVLSNTAIIHPVSQATVSDKTSSPNHLINDSELFSRTSELDFEYEQEQHPNHLMRLFYYKVALHAFIAWWGAVVGDLLRPLYAPSQHRPIGKVWAFFRH